MQRRKLKKRRGWLSAPREEYLSVAYTVEREEKPMPWYGYDSEAPPERIPSCRRRRKIS